MKTSTKNLSLIFAFIVSLIAITFFTTNQTSATNQIILQDGSLITNATTNKVYIVQSENNIIFRRELLDKRVISAYPNLSMHNIISVNNDIFSRLTPSNLLIEVDHRKIPINGKIYALSVTPGASTITKHHLNITPYEFEMLGLQWGGVYPINSIEASLYPEGTSMSASMIAQYIILPNQNQTSHTKQQIQNYNYGYNIPAHHYQTNINQNNYNISYPQNPYTTSSYQPQKNNRDTNSVTIYEPYGVETYSNQKNSVTIYESPYQNTTYAGNPYIGSVPKPQTQQHTTTQTQTQQNNKAQTQKNNKTQTQQKTASKPSQISTISRYISSEYKRENTTNNPPILRSSLLVASANKTQTTQSNNNTENNSNSANNNTENNSNSANNNSSEETTTETSILELVHRDNEEIIKLLLGGSLARP